MTDDTQSLIERIRVRHQLEAERSGVDRFVFDHSYKCLQWHPATDRQLEQTESRLGFPLPDFLWQVYREIANGGFGPAYGITGVLGGTPHAGGWYRDIIDGYQQISLIDYDPEFDSALRAPSTNPAYISLYQIPEARLTHVRFELQEREWPEFLLPFCYWGCNTEHAIHAMSGEVFVVIDGHCFANWAPSLEVWFEHWLDGTLEQE